MSVPRLGVVPHSAALPPGCPTRPDPGLRVHFTGAIARAIIPQGSCFSPVFER